MIIFVIVSAALCLLLAVTMLTTHLIIKRQFGRRGRYPDFPVADWFYDHYQKDYPRVSHQFPSGKNLLRGYVYGEKNTKGLIVFAHGIGTGHESYLQEILWMVDHGFRVFSYDASGSCDSEGTGTVGLIQSALDLDAALSYVESQKEFEGLSIFLMGHSWGAYAVTAGLYFDHKITASVSIAGFCEPVEMMMQFAKVNMGKATTLLTPFVALDTRFIFGKYATLTASDGINEHNTPVLLIHGTKDEMIPLESASIIAHADEFTNPNVKIRIFERAGQSGHNSIFYDKDSLSHIEHVDRQYKKLSDAHGGKIPNDVRAEFYDTQADRALINTPNLEMMEEIYEFFVGEVG